MFTLLYARALEVAHLPRQAPLLIVQGLRFLLSGIYLFGPRPCADLNEMLSHNSMYLNSGPHVGHCVGRLRRYGLVGRSMSLTVGFESQKTCAISSLFSELLPVVQDVSP